MTITAQGDDDVHHILGADILIAVLGFLDWREILIARVSRSWREAARLTNVPRSSIKVRGMTMSEIYVRNRGVALALEWISDALPKIPQLNFAFDYGTTEKFDIEEGEDAEASLFFLAPSLPAVDISPIANFRDLRDLSLHGTDLNGSYSFLFDFPNLETLDLCSNGRLTWDLKDLSGVPRLKKLRCIRNYSLTGNLRSLRVLRLTLAELTLAGCELIEGKLSDLFDFPCLESLCLNSNNITGDIRDIGPNDFKLLRDLDVGDKVYGGGDLPSIEETPAIMLARYYLKKRNPDLFGCRRWGLPLESPERYTIRGHHSRQGPFHVEFVKAGHRLGWRWTNCVSGGSCETNWIDAEPDPTEEGYDEYIKELKRVENDVGFYKGFLAPPTEEEHSQRCAEVPLDRDMAMYSSRNCFGEW